MCINLKLYTFFSIIATVLAAFAVAKKIPANSSDPFKEKSTTDFSSNLPGLNMTNAELLIDNAFSSYTKLFVVGGYNGSRLSRVEVFDLEDDSKTFSHRVPAHYPIRNYGMTVGVIENTLKACGGSFRSRKCYDYHPDKDKWARSTPMMFKRIHHAASFIASYWLLSGSDGSTGGHKMTEIWTGSVFVRGPDLPRGMNGHCQLTINATHIFFAMADRKPNYLLNWPEQTWIKLAPTAHSIANCSCGLIKNAKNEREAVVAGYGRSEIFSFKRLLWRNGPAPPYFYDAGYTQLSDTFIVIGGRNISTHFLDTLYKFDNINYNWIQLRQRLRIPASSLGVVSVPDNFVVIEKKLQDLAFNRLYFWARGLPQDTTSASPSVELIDLNDLYKRCKPVSNSPVGKYAGAVGTIQGVIKMCGGDTWPHTSTNITLDDCYDYHPINDSWVKSASLMVGRFYARNSFIDRVWLLSGGGNTTEMWTGSGFEAGPTLKREMSAHCQLTLNATHVFFADSDPVGTNYLLNWPEQTWTELPQTPDSNSGPSCGLINNPRAGLEAVISGHGGTDIFNFNNLTWRTGPSIPNSHNGYAGYAQLSDTFVVAGGTGPDGYLDTIYKFDNINYGWDLLPKRLSLARSHYPAVITVPDSFVSCN